MNLHAFIILATLSMAAAVLWSDPRRLANQAFALIALLSTSWVFVLWVLRTVEVEDPVPLIRAISALVTLIPWAVWWAGECILKPQNRWRNSLRDGWGWLLVAVLLSAIALSDWFIPPESTRTRPLRGGGYAFFQTGMTVACLGLFVYGFVAGRESSVRKRTDLRIMVFCGAVACLLGTVAASLFRALSAPVVVASITPVFVLLFFTIATAAIITRHGPEAQHRHIAILRRTALLLAISCAAVITMRSGFTGLPAEMLLIVILVAGATVVLLLDGRLRSAQSWLIGREDEVAAAALQKLGRELQGRPDQESLGKMAEKIAGLLDCSRSAIFWRTDKVGAFARLSLFPAENDAPEVIPADSVLVAESVSHNEAWLLPGSHDVGGAWLREYRVCVPVFEGGIVRMLILLGESERTLGYSMAEMSALQALGATISHNLAMREMLTRQAAQEQLALAGKLAAGIAHNIRNPLAVVRACLEADPALPDGSARELHEAAVVKVRSIQSTVDSLSALARGERFALERHDLASLIRGVLVDQADYLAQCGARVEFVAKQAVWWGLVEPHQFSIALTNLIRNAAEEIAKAPGGGQVSITVGDSLGGLLTVRIADTGRGLPQHIVEAVFTRDLFAKTTKVEGRPARRTGYGIGLHSTMLIITTGHGGKFEYRDGAFHLSILAAT